MNRKMPGWLLTRLILIMCAVMLFAFPAAAEESPDSDGEGLTWELTDGVLTVSGTGDMTDAPWWFSADSIRKAVIGEGIRSICDGAFWDCPQLTEVSLPGSLTKIGNNAFYKCSGLTSVTIPGSVKEIGEFAFCDSGLQHVVLNEGLEGIPYSSFYNCSGLTDVTIPGSVRVIGEYAFSGSGLQQVTMNEGLEEIQYCAFYNCKNLKQATVPQSLKTVGDWAFENDTVVLYAVPGSAGAMALGKANLNFREAGGQYQYKYRFEGDSAAALVLTAPIDKNIGTVADFSDQVTEIGDSAFRECANLTSVRLSAGVVSIGWGAFENCKNLAEVSLPSGLKKIDYCAFFGCSSLKRLNIPDNLGEVNGCFSDNTVLYAKIGSTGAKALGKGGYEFRPAGNDGFLMHYKYEGDTLKGLELRKILKPKSTVKVPEGVTTLRSDSAGVLSQCGDKVTCLELPDTIDSLQIASLVGARRTFYIKCSKGSYAERFAKKHGFQYVTGSGKVIGSDITDVDAKVNWIISHYITSGMSEYEKVRTINDWLICNAHYDYSYSAHGADGVLINGSGVCESYARAAEKLLNKAGIENILIIGTANNGTGNGYEDHAWNLVKVNGSWYHLDTTWNDPTNWGEEAVISGYECYSYFLVTDDQIGKDHKWSSDIPGTGPRRDDDPEDDRISISEAKVSKIRDREYTGKAIKPKVTVKYNKEKLEEGTDYTVSYKANKKIGTAKITIKGKGNYTGKKEITFKILPKAVALKNIKAGKKELKVSWDKGEDVQGYEVQYSLKKDFKDAETVKISKPDKTSKNIKDLKGGKKYYVRVRAWKKTGGKVYYSAWSDVMNKKTKK